MFQVFCDFRIYFLIHNMSAFLLCKVEGYYDFIEEPMDFGTMRAKLHEEKYTTLQQFEVCSLMIMFLNVSYIIG